MKKIVYTVVLGDFILHEPKHKNDEWELICFTDRNIKSKNWKIINVTHKDPLKKSREIKIRCDKFLDFDLCVYLDSQFTIRCDLNQFVENNMKTDFSLMGHKRRKCVYDEAAYCIFKQRGNKDIISKQIEYYKEMGFPKNFGLYACGIMIRKNSSKVIEFMKLWYDEVQKFSYRDQISFPYILWKYPIDLDIMKFQKTYNLFKK
jgi:hypothetical protein